MANIETETDLSQDAESSTNNDDCCAENLLLNGVYLPDVFINIFCYLDSKSLLQSRFVCKAWKKVIDRNVWYEKAKRYKKSSYSDVEFSQFNVDLPVAYTVDNCDPFNKNLLRNTCGEDGFNHWLMLRPQRRYVQIENEPVGSEALPNHSDFNGNHSCFATSYEWCKMKQVINLARLGLNSHIMDVYKPAMNVSGWYAGRFDAGCQYKLKLLLLDDTLTTLETKKFERTLSKEEGRVWHKASFVVEDYPPGVRHLRFCQIGKDVPWWAGFYGVKMAGSSLTLSCPFNDSKK